MKTTRTIVTFMNFQDVEYEVVAMLSSKHLNFGISHDKGVTTVLINGKVTLSDLEPIGENISKIYYEENYKAHDDPNDIVETLRHNLSGLIDS